MKNKTWYSAKSIFLHRDTGSGPRQQFEERVVLVRARGIRKAMKIATREAKSYAHDLPSCEFTGYVSVFRPFDKPQHLAELYSAMHHSEVSSDEYLESHYPRDPSSCDELGREHRLYNRGHGSSACYHCDFVQKQAR